MMTNRLIDVDALDPDIVDKAKDYAQSDGLSLSQWLGELERRIDFASPSEQLGSSLTASQRTSHSASPNPEHESSLALLTLQQGYTKPQPKPSHSKTLDIERCVIEFYVIHQRFVDLIESQPKLKRYTTRLDELRRSAGMFLALREPTGAIQTFIEKFSELLKKFSQPIPPDLLRQSESLIYDLSQCVALVPEPQPKPIPQYTQKNTPSTSPTVQHEAPLMNAALSTKLDTLLEALEQHIDRRDGNRIEHSKINAFIESCSALLEQFDFRQLNATQQKVIELVHRLMHELKSTQASLTSHSESAALKTLHHKLDTHNERISQTLSRFEHKLQALYELQRLPNSSPQIRNQQSTHSETSGRRTPSNASRSYDVFSKHNASAELTKNQKSSAHESQSSTTPWGYIHQELAKRFPVNDLGVQTEPPHTSRYDSSNKQQFRKTQIDKTWLSSHSRKHSSTTRGLSSVFTTMPFDFNQVTQMRLLFGVFAIGMSVYLYSPINSAMLNLKHLVTQAPNVAPNTSTVLSPSHSPAQKRPIPSQDLTQTQPLTPQHSSTQDAHFNSNAPSPDVVLQLRTAEAMLLDRGNTQKVRAALALLVDLSTKGNAQATRDLAQAYEKGVAVAQNHSKALELYRQAAEQGDPPSMYNYALMLLENAQSDHPETYAEAAKWFENAAIHGIRDSQYNLALLYKAGIGVPKDPVKAYLWFTESAKSGDVKTQEYANQVYASLSTQERARIVYEQSVFHSQIEQNNRS